MTQTYLPDGMIFKWFVLLTLLKTKLAVLLHILTTHLKLNTSKITIKIKKSKQNNEKSSTIITLTLSV